MQEKFLKQTEKMYVRRVIKMTSLCSLGIIIPEIWKLVQTSFQGCFVIYTLRSKLPRTIEKSIRRLKESIIKFLQEIFQSISA